MRIHYLQHAPFEGPAHLAAIARARGLALTGSELHAGAPLPDAQSFDLLAVLGGPMGVSDESIHPWLPAEKRCIERAIQSGKRVIGICLGAQLIAEVLGATVYKNPFREIGWFPVTRSSGAVASGIGRSLPDTFPAFHWHGDTFSIPAGAAHVAESPACENQGFVLEDRVVALQFHLEATPGSIRALVDNCRDDLDGSEFVQSEQDILNPVHIGNSNRLFEGILSNLTS